MRLLLLGIVCVVVAARRVLGVAAVVGLSMEPTLSQGDRVLYRRTRRVRRGQVVVLDTARLDHLVPAAAGSAARSPELMIKRVAAVAGDPWPEGVPRVAGIVGTGRVVVLGDGKASMDSRQWGAIPIEVVHGVVLRTMVGFDRRA
jgi:signal peptidase I